MKLQRFRESQKRKGLGSRGANRHQAEIIDSSWEGCRWEPLARRIGAAGESIEYEGTSELLARLPRSFLDGVRMTPI